MQRGPEPEARPVAIVLGCDEIGSAVAHRLHRDGFAVVLIGSVGGMPITAPIDGCLRGLSARGARLRVGSELVEIDPRADPTRCFGLDERSTAIARGVSAALEDEGSPRRAAGRKRGLTAAP